MEKLGIQLNGYVKPIITWLFCVVAGIKQDEL